MIGVAWFSAAEALMSLQHTVELVCFNGAL
jgi:hypothetical protein